jgi:hypothetical protein
MEGLIPQEYELVLDSRSIEIANFNDFDLTFAAMAAPNN